MLLPAMIALPCQAVSDPRATIILRLEKGDRAGLELYDTTIGTPPRNVVAIKRILPNGKANRNGRIQQGMILPQFPDAQSVTEKVIQGPYPIDIEIYNLAAGGDAFGDLGKPLVRADDALELAKAASKPKEGIATDSSQVYVTRQIRPGIAEILSRRGDVLEINYTARFGGEDGPIYDSSAQRGTGQPYQFVLGSGDMIPGVDNGLYDMKPGEVRMLEIPSALGHGKNGNALFGIPSGSKLYWMVQLVALNSVREGDERTRDEIEERAAYY